MYDVFASDEYFFNDDVFFAIETKDKQRLLSIIDHKQKLEIQENIPIITKKNDLIIWNAIFIREIIKKGSSKQYLHPLYNKYYKSIQSCNDIKALQKIEIQMATSYFDNFIINKTISYLYTHLENHLSLEEIANGLNISTGYLSSCFRKNMNTSVMSYFKKIKIERGKTLLLDSNKSILEISTLLGFCDQCHFSKIFKSETGYTPTQWRNLKL